MMWDTERERVDEVIRDTLWTAVPQMQVLRRGGRGRGMSLMEASWMAVPQM